jgi:hypothetical protein
LDTVPAPEGLILTVKVYWLCEKLAVTFLGPLIVMEVGLVELDKSPDQFRKV